MKAARTSRGARRDERRKDDGEKESEKGGRNERICFLFCGKRVTNSSLLFLETLNSSANDLGQQISAAIITRQRSSRARSSCFFFCDTRFFLTTTRNGTRFLSRSERNINKSSIWFHFWCHFCNTPPAIDKYASRE